LFGRIAVGKSDMMPLIGRPRADIHRDPLFASRRRPEPVKNDPKVICPVLTDRHPTATAPRKNEVALSVITRPSRLYPKLDRAFQ